MGWLSKIFKGSTHKILEGHCNGKYADERVWNEKSSSLDALPDYEKEDIDRAIALSLSEEEQKKVDVIDNGLHNHFEEDEQLARALQESLNVESPPRENGRIYHRLPFPFMTGFRICAGCNSEIGQGRFLSCMGAVWHPECFHCHACNLPISEYEFSMYDNHPYHKSCYKELYHPRCDVCNQFIPTNMFGLIEYRAHPFWLQKYCPSHEHDGTPRCCSCERMEGHHHLPETRGLCLSEEQTVSSILRRPIFGFGNRIVEMITEPYKLIRRCEVTAILVLYGLPRLLTGSILAHEMMHAWLRLNGYSTLSPEVEEGICQVLAHMWLDSEIISGSGSHVASTSSSSSAPTSKKGMRSQFEKKLGDFFKHQIESDTSSAYGDGFRAGNQAVLRYGLRRTLNHIKLTGNFPY